MKRKPRPPPAHQESAAGPVGEAQEPGADDDLQRIVSRPDGYHWVAVDGRQEFGPFETREEALADMLAPGEDDAALGDAPTLQEVEREIGISDWTDPETGEPAEGQSPPHLEDE
ncbi:MAG: hypothetical protein OEY03_03080 [Rhizobacter sp.]|nr:hypothetical protein [Rhizobacter sp.]